jgi:hypothetical protein
MDPDVRPSQQIGTVVGPLLTPLSLSGPHSSMPGSRSRTQVIPCSPVMSCIIFPGGETKEILGQPAQENVAPEENSEKNINIRPQEHHENKNTPSLLPVPYFPDVASAGPSCNPSPATPTPASATPTPASATPTPASATPSQAATPTPTCRGLFTAAAGRGVSPLTPTTTSSKQRSIRGIVLSSSFGYHFDMFEVPSIVADSSDPYVFGTS